MDDNNKQVGLTPEGNVLITQEEIENSKREESLSLRNVTKTPLYKLAAKLYETSVSLIELLPKRFTGFSDQIIHDAAETLKLVSFVPNAPREEQLFYLNQISGLLYVMKTHFIVMHKHKMLSQDLLNKVKRLAEQGVSQATSMFDYIMREGHTGHRV